MEEINHWTTLFFSTCKISIIWLHSTDSEFNTFDVKLSVSTICLTVIFQLSGAEESSENRLCHRQTKALETLIPLCVFSSSCLFFICDLPSSTQTIMYVSCSALSPKLKLKPLFIFNKSPLNTRCLFIVRANVSNLSQIDVRFVMDR